MSDEITVTGRLRGVNGNLTSNVDSGSIQIDQSNKGARGGTQKIGTTYEAIDYDDVATPGYAFFRNQDATNFVEIGLDGGAALDVVMKLEPGEIALFRVGGSVALYAKADTAECLLEVLILED